MALQYGAAYPVSDNKFTFLPPHTLAVVNSDLLHYGFPGQKIMATLPDTSFTATTAPLWFRNYITYQWGDTAGVYRHISNSFFLRQVQSQKYTPQGESIDMTALKYTDRDKVPAANVLAAVSSLNRHLNIGIFIAFLLIVALVTFVGSRIFN